MRHFKRQRLEPELFSDLLKNDVTFYRTSLPVYAAVIHLGGAPNWVVRQWLTLLKGEAPDSDVAPEQSVALPKPLMDLIGKDYAKLGEPSESPDEAVIELMEAAVEDAEAEGADTY